MMRKDKRDIFISYSSEDKEIADYKALIIREKVLGMNHVDTAGSYSNIGVVYRNMGDNDKAKEFYYKTLDVFEKVLGAEHPSTATVYGNIGELYYSQGYYDSSLKYFLKALTVFERVYGPENKETQALREWVEDVRGKMEE